MNWLVLTLMAFTGAVAFHCALARVPGSMNAVLRFFGTGSAAGLALAAALCWQHVSAICAAAGVALFAFLCELYVFFFTFVISSLSVAILIKLRTTGEILKAGPETASEMVRHRLLALEDNGFLYRRGSVTSLTRKGRIVLSVYRGLRRFFHHDPT